MIISFLNMSFETYYGEGFNPKTDIVNFYGRIVHISVGRRFWNFHLWGIRPGSEAWTKQYPWLPK
jgi:hypothetical protein